MAASHLKKHGRENENYYILNKMLTTCKYLHNVMDIPARFC